MQRIFRFRRWLLLSALVLLASGVALAGKYNPKLSIGDAAPAFKGLQDAAGKEYSLADLKDKEVVVIVFTSNTCPTAVDYEDRLIALGKKFAVDSKCALLVINPNKVEGDLLHQLGEKAAAKKFNFPYVHDDDAQSTAKAYGATYTPEFFVLNKDRKVVYMGAMDDKTMPGEVKEQYVVAAVDAALAGKLPEVTETAARGCTVRYARDRKKKAE
jgi:peroxiredoxin